MSDTNINPPTDGGDSISLANSKIGADTILPHSLGLRQQVLSYIIRQGDNGATDQEIQHALGMRGNTERPRRWELWKAGAIKVARDSGGALMYRFGQDGDVRARQLVFVSGAEQHCDKCNIHFTLNNEGEWRCDCDATKPRKPNPLRVRIRELEEIVQRQEQEIARLSDDLKRFSA